MVKVFIYLALFSLLFATVLSFSTKTPLTLFQSNRLKGGSFGICNRPGFNNYTYVCAALGGIYQVDTTTGAATVFVQPSDALGCDDCAFTPSGNIIAWSGLFTNYVKVQNMAGLTSHAVTVGQLNVANGITCYNETLCFASNTPNVGEGCVIVGFNPQTPSAGLVLYYDLCSNTHHNFSCGLDGMSISSEGFLYANVCDNPNGVLNAVLKYDVLQPNNAPVVINSGFIDGESVKLSPDQQTLYILEEARSEIYSLPIDANINTQKVLVGAIRNPAYIDNFCVVDNGLIYISETANSGIYALNPTSNWIGNLAPNAFYLVGVTSTRTTIESQSQLGLPYGLQIVPPTSNIVTDQMTPMQQLLVTVNSSNSFIAKNEIYVADFYSLRVLTAATPDTLVTTTDEFGLNFNFGITSLHVTGSLVYGASILGGFFVRDRYLGTPLGNVGAPWFRPYGMSNLTNGSLLVADHGFPTVPAATYPNCPTCHPTIPSHGSQSYGGYNPSIYMVTHLTPTGANFNPSISLVADLSAHGYHGVVGVAADPVSNTVAYFTDFNTGSLVKMDYTNPARVTFTNITTGNVTLHCPSAIALHYTGSQRVIYIADAYLGRIISYVVETNTATVLYSGLNQAYLSTCTTGRNNELGFSTPALAVDATGQNLVFSSDVDLVVYWLH